MPSSTVEARIDGFISSYNPEIQSQLRVCRDKLRVRFRRGYELVYDNYNALAFGYGASEKSSGAIVSLVAYPRWVTVFFLDGANLDDPEKRLKGTGRKVRSIRLAGPETIDEPAVQTLLDQALAPAADALAGAPKLKTLVKSVSAKQRPRRPK